MRAICEEEEEDDSEEGAEASDTHKKPPVPMRIQETFLKERKIFLWGQINDASAKDITEKLLYLDLEKPGTPITFYINTPGGCVTSGMAIYDTMRLIRSPISVVVTGMAASFGSILLCAPKNGRRFLYPNARVLLHQPLISGRFFAPAVDINIQAQEMERTREELNRILAEATGQPLDKIGQDTDRDFYLNAQEAIEYGIADTILQPGDTPFVDGLMR